MERPKGLPGAFIDDRARTRHEARRALEQRTRGRAIAFGASALGLLADLFSRRAGGSGGIALRGAISRRAPAEIVGELNRFYSVRPRPWRPAHCASKAMRAPKVRYRRYRRSQAKAALGAARHRQAAA